MLTISPRPRTTLLINPPLWNAYAPHLAVPLLAGALRARGMPVRSHDASIAVLDWFLSADGLAELAPRLDRTSDRHLAARARLVHPYAVSRVEDAKAVLRSIEALQDPERHAWARTVMRDAMSCVSAAFDGLSFDLVANPQHHRATSTREVLAAVDDVERNPYRWAIEVMLPTDLLADPEIGQVGLSVSADTQLIAALTIAAHIRRVRPDVAIIMGGNYATRMVDRWEGPHPFFDYVDVVVRSEGEEILPEVVSRLTGGEPLRDLSGVCVVDDGRLVRREARPVRLDHVPAPDFSDMPLGRYFAPGPILPLFASRSCAWSCAFCSIPFASNNFRRQPASVTVDHIEHLMRTYGTRYFMFVDEILTPNVLRDVAQEIVDRDLDIRWYGETRFAGALRQGLSDLLYASGCRRLDFGLESYNQRVLDLMSKGTRIEDIDAGVEAMLRSGISPHLFVIHGFPGETEEEAARTVEFARAAADRSRRSFANPYTTWGGAPFVLDVHSPVGREPERFGIEVVDPHPDEDLALSREYRVLATAGERPLGQAEALRISQAARDRLSIERNVWFRSQTVSTLTEVEEFTFMRASTGAPPARERRRPIAAHLLPTEAVITLTASAERMPWPAGSGDPRDALALYNGDADTFVQLPWPNGRSLDLLRRGPRVEELARWFEQEGVAWGECTGRGLVELLHRHRLIEVAGARTSVITDVDRWRFRPEPVVLDALDERGSRVLHNPVTGTTVRLAPIADLLWSMVHQGPTSPSAVVADVLGAEFADWAEATTAAATALAEQAMIHPVLRESDVVGDRSASGTVAGV